MRQYFTAPAALMAHLRLCTTRYGYESVSETVRHILTEHMVNFKRHPTATVGVQLGSSRGAVGVQYSTGRALCITNLSKKLVKKPTGIEDKLWPEKLADVKQTLETLGVYTSWLIPISPSKHFADPDFWLAIDAWMETVPNVYYLDELKAYVAYQQAQSQANRHKDPRRGFRNWLATAKRWKERDAEKQAIYARR